MNARKDSHRHMTWIVADEHLVNLENRAEFSIEHFGRYVRQIEIHLVLAADAHAADAHLEDLASRDVARNEVAVSRIFLFEEIPAFFLRYRRRRPLITLSARHPDSSAFATRRFRHQTQLVFTRNR